MLDGRGGLGGLHGGSSLGEGFAWRLLNRVANKTYWLEVRRQETRRGRVPIHYRKGMTAQEAVQEAMEKAKAEGGEWPVDTVEWEWEPLGLGEEVG